MDRIIWVLILIPSILYVALVNFLAYLSNLLMGLFDALEVGCHRHISRFMRRVEKLRGKQ